MKYGFRSRVDLQAVTAWRQHDDHASYHMGESISISTGLIHGMAATVACSSTNEPEMWRIFRSDDKRESSGQALAWHISLLSAR